jgi:predicted nucleic acid-binding protein
MKALLDTCILIDYLNGIDAAREEIVRYTNPLISPITWIEVMVGAKAGEQTLIGGFLRRFEQVPVNQDVAEHAVQLRRAHRIRLPDAIIWASARSRSVLLVTRNTKDFPIDEPGVRLPY